MARGVAYDAIRICLSASEQLVAADADRASLSLVACNSRSARLNSGVRPQNADSGPSDRRRRKTCPTRRHYAKEMAQNIYDDPAFFEAYSKLRRSVDGLAGAAEWPALMALLPDMRRLILAAVMAGFAVGRASREPKPFSVSTYPNGCLSEQKRYLLTLRSPTQKPIWKSLICQRQASIWPIVRSHFITLRIWPACLKKCTTRWYLAHS